MSDQFVQSVSHRINFACFPAIMGQQNPVGLFLHSFGRAFKK